MKAWINIFLIIAVFIFPASVMAQQLNCKPFHTGKFKIIDTAHKSNIYIDRNDSLETRMMYRQKPGSIKETYDMQVVFKITWINDCTYTARLIKTIIPTPKGERLLPSEKKIITVSILKSSGNAYLEEGVFNDKHHTTYRYIVYRLK
ncbi:MAG: hypothetical protein ACTHJ0_08120 [Flavipsychrobacter sp.]